MVKIVFQAVSVVVVILAVLHNHEGLAAVTTSALPQTTHAPVTVLIGQNENVYIVRPDGCYQLHVTKQHIHALKSHHGNESERMAAQLDAVVDKATSIHEIDHHSIDHEHQDVQTLCQELPVFRFTVTDHQ